MYQSVSDETKALFKERIDSKHLDGISWEVVDNDKLKKTNNMCGKTLVNNATVRAVTNVDVIFEINEAVFDRLTELYQLITIDKLLAYVEYDMEKESIKKNSPDVQEHSGILLKYEAMKLQELTSEVQRIYTELKEENAKSDGK